MEKDEIIAICLNGLQEDGAHHKQYYLEEILKLVAENYEELKKSYQWDDGVAG